MGSPDIHLKILLFAMDIVWACTLFSSPKTYIIYHFVLKPKAQISSDIMFLLNWHLNVHMSKSSALRLSSSLWLRWKLKLWYNNSYDVWQYCWNCNSERGGSIVLVSANSWNKCLWYIILCQCFAVLELLLMLQLVPLLGHQMSSAPP